MSPPEPPGDAALHWVREYARLTPGWADLFGSRASWNEIIERLRRYPQDQVLYHLAQVNSVLARNDTVEGQAGLLRELFTDAAQGVAVRVDQFREREARDLKEPPFLFHYAQVLTAAKCALKVSRSPHPEESMRHLGEALLMITDVLQRDDPELADVVSEMVASQLFHSSEAPVNALGRAYDLYMVDHRSLRSDASYIDLPQELQRVTGLQPELLWLMLFLAYTGLQSRPMNEVGKPFRLADYLGRPWDLAPGVATHVFSPEEIARIVALLVTDADTLEGEIAQVPEEYRLYDVRAFARHPIVRVNGLDLCLCEPLLFRKLTAGVHHIFLDPNSTERKQRARYLRFTGRMFERYVDALLNRCFGPNAHQGAGTYSGLLPGRGESCCDAVWRSGDALVLFEMKAGQFDQHARAGDTASLQKKLGELVVRAAEQIDSTIALFKAGELPQAGPNPNEVRRFFPIAILLEPMTMEPVLHTALLSTIAAKQVLQSDGVRPLQLLNVAEVEELEVGLGRRLKLLHILAKKIDLPLWRAAGFSNFLRFQYPNEFADTRNPHLARVVDEAVARAKSLIELRTSRA